jgi:hypothetical protein
LSICKGNAECCSKVCVKVRYNRYHPTGYCR